jgi:hypothetical protein
MRREEFTARRSSLKMVSVDNRKTSGQLLTRDLEQHGVVHKCWLINGDKVFLTWTHHDW